MCKMNNYANVWGFFLLCKDTWTGEWSPSNPIKAVERWKSELIRWQIGHISEISFSHLSSSFCPSTFYMFFTLLLVHLNRRNSLFFFLFFKKKTRNGLITACHGCPRIMMGLRCCAFPHWRFGCLTSSSSTSKLENAPTFKWIKSQPKR